jgi:hypothetical protein
VRRRLLNVLAALSLLLCSALVALIIAQNWWETSGPHLLSDAGPRLAVHGNNLSAFNRGLPYTGSIMGIGSAGPPSAIDFDLAGVYFRYFRLGDATSWWTLSVPLPYLFALTAVFPGLWVIARNRRFARVTAGQCPACGYDLRATPGRCPECGDVAGARGRVQSWRV